MTNRKLFGLGLLTVSDQQLIGGMPGGGNQKGDFDMVIDGTEAVFQIVSPWTFF
jgi:hypothetical protein